MESFERGSLGFLELEKISFVFFMTSATFGLTPKNALHGNCDGIWIRITI